MIKLILQTWKHGEMVAGENSLHTTHNEKTRKAYRNHAEVCEGQCSNSDRFPGYPSFRVFRKASQAITHLVAGLAKLCRRTKWRRECIPKTLVACGGGISMRCFLLLASPQLVVSNWLGLHSTPAVASARAGETRKPQVRNASRMVLHTTPPRLSGAVCVKSASVEFFIIIPVCT